MKIDRNAGASVFEVLTCHRTRLNAEKSSGQLCHQTEANGNFSVVLCFRPPARQNVCFLVAEDGDQILKAAPQPERSSVIGFRLDEETPGVFSLWHPLLELFLSAEPPTDHGGSILLNRSRADAWERFELHPSNQSNAALEMISDLSSRLTTSEAVIAYLEAELSAKSAAALEAILRTLPSTELMRLGGSLLSRPAAVAAFAKHLPDDLWASEALPDLLRNLQAAQDAQTPIRSIDRRYDRLAEAALFGKYVSSAQMLNSFARRSRHPRKGLCIVATARNEGPYILEWLAHHRDIGVEHFFIYTNDNDDGSDELLAALALGGAITLIVNSVGPSTGPQFKAYGHAFQMLPDILDYAWAAVVDLDEFIVFDTTRFRSIGNFIEHIDREGADAIALNWCFFHPTDQVRRAPNPITRRFGRRSRHVDMHVKTLCRPSMFVHSQCHFPIWDSFATWKFRNADGSEHLRRVEDSASAFSERPIDEGAWINHYYMKSAEEFAFRRITGHADRALTRQLSASHLTSQHFQTFRSVFGSPDLVADERIISCSPDLEKSITSLKHMQGVESGLALVERTYVRRWNEVVTALRLDPRFHQSGSDEEWFFRLIGGASAASANADIELFERQSKYEESLDAYTSKAVGFSGNRERMAPPHFRFALAACARWETPYIVEWITYHLSIGFEHIFLYCNDDDPEAMHRAVLPFIAKAKPEVTFLHYRFQGLQFQIYLHYFRNFAHLSEYAMLLDIDEFLCLPGVDDLAKFINETPFAFDALYFNWIYYGTNWHKTRPPGDVLTNYTKRQSIIAPLTKVLIETSKIPFAQFVANRLVSVMHDYTSLDPNLRAFNVVGHPMQNYYMEFPNRASAYLSDPAISAAIRDRAYVAHFHMKSDEDYDLRVKRGIKGDYEVESMWGVKTEAERRDHNAFTNEEEDFYLRDYWRNLLGRAWTSAVFPRAVHALLSRDRPANQSSTAHAPRTTQEDAAMLVSGVLQGAPQNHTELEANPWWYVDLERPCIIREVWLYNRLDGALDRVARFVVAISLDGLAWRHVFAKTDDAIYGGADGAPFRCAIHDDAPARYVVVTIPTESGYLHFDQIEVFGDEAAG